MELLSYHLENNKPFVIAPLGDIQYNGSDHEIWSDGLKRHIDWALEQNAYFIGMGDYIDFASPSSRRKLLSSGAYEGPMQKLDDVALELTYQVYEKYLKKTKGRWIGMLEGHHYWQLKDGSTTDMRLCEMLDTVHLGTEAVIDVKIPRIKATTGTGTFQIYAHHGVGGGEESAMLMRMKKIAADWDKVRIFLHGHCTKVATTVVPKLEAVFGFKSAALVERRVLLVGTGGWSKGKIVGAREGRVPRGGYVEKKLLRPVSLGAPLIKCWPAFVRVGPSDHNRNKPTFFNLEIEVINR